MHGALAVLPERRGELKFVRTLNSLVELGVEERSLLYQLKGPREVLLPGRELSNQARPTPARIVISGWGCRQQVLRNGRRQIFGFIIPGDTIGLMRTGRPADELQVVALTKMECADATFLREALETQESGLRGLQEALKAALRYEETCLLNHVVRLGQLSAPERIAHLFLELRQRCRRAGLADGERFPMPINQEALSDAVGLSTVHLNRTIQAMKRAGLIDLEHGWLTILALERMLSLADFDDDDDPGSDD